MKTGLKIRVLEGQTVDGRTEYEFPASRSQPDELIVVGRDPDHCQIVFVDDLRHHGLCNEHMAFRRSLGRYQLDLNTHNAVLVDGRPSFEDKELRGTHELQLGEKVRLEVTVVDTRSATVGARPHHQPHEVALRNRRLLVGLAAAVAVLAVGGWWGMWQQGERTRKAETAAAEARAALASLASVAPVSDQVIARVRNSIYAVILRSAAGNEGIIGTGWSAAGGKVVTNVHVVDYESDPQLLEVIEDGGELIVRSAVPPYRTHRVTGRTSHPGHRRFQEVIAGVQPLRKSLGGFEQLDFDLACDVAILDVEDPAGLAAPLEIAPRDDLRDLRSGQPIAMVGYPGEGMIANVVTRPEPVSQKASIVRMTDFFMEHREDGGNHLVQHSLPVAGGASGSPVVNGDGRVIAVVTAINPVMIPGGAGEAGEASAAEPRGSRIMNPAAINFAQRADFVLDLLEGRAAEATAGYAADWLDRLTRLDRLSEQAIPLRQQVLAASFGRPVEPRVVHEFTGRAGRRDADVEIEDLPAVEIDLPRGLISVVAVPTGSIDVDAALLDGPRVILEAMDTTFTYHGDILFANRFARPLKFVAWFDGEQAAAPVDYRATVIDWGIDPDEFLAHAAVEHGQSALGTTAPPTRSFDLPPIRLDSTVEIDGRDVVAGQVSWTLPQPAICALTCRLSRATGAVLLESGPDGPKPVSQPAESPCTLIPCLAAGEAKTLLLVTPFVDPGDEPLTLEVHVDTWQDAGEAAKPR